MFLKILIGVSLVELEIMKMSSHVFRFEILLENTTIPMLCLSKRLMPKSRISRIGETNMDVFRRACFPISKVRTFENIQKCKSIC